MIQNGHRQCRVHDQKEGMLSYHYPVLPRQPEKWNIYFSRAAIDIFAVVLTQLWFWAGEK
jgi:hypothetical protein